MFADVICDASESPFEYESSKCKCGRARACGSSSRRERAISAPRWSSGRSVGHQDSRIETDPLNTTLSNDDSRDEEKARIQSPTKYELLEMSGYHA